MPRTRTAVAMGAAALIVGTTGTVYAVADEVRSGGSDQRVDHQAARWRTGDLEFTAQKWRPLDWSTDGTHFVSDGTVLRVQGRGTVSATLSASLRGGPVKIRVLAGRHVMHPGVVRFDPQGHSTSLSFTFLRRIGHPDCGRDLFVELQPLTDEPVRLKSAALVATCKRYLPDADVGCV